MLAKLHNSLSINPNYLTTSEQIATRLQAGLTFDSTYGSRFIEVITANPACTIFFIDFEFLQLHNQTHLLEVAVISADGKKSFHTKIKPQCSLKELKSKINLSTHYIQTRTYLKFFGDNDDDTLIGDDFMTKEQAFGRIWELGISAISAVLEWSWGNIDMRFLTAGALEVRISDTRIPLLENTASILHCWRNSLPGLLSLRLESLYPLLFRDKWGVISHSAFGDTLKLSKIVKL